MSAIENLGRSGDPRWPVLVSGRGGRRAAESEGRHLADQAVPAM